MKDLPHHLKKLNRQIIRSAHREEMVESTFDLDDAAFKAAFRKETTPAQKKKQHKEMLKQEKEHRLLFPETPEEQNVSRKHRTPQTRDRTRQAPGSKSKRVAAKAKMSKSSRSSRSK
jgi:hypothetical protein